ncbi:hypothetical protein GH714_020185 [Hevea brasiliensis]|uniref:Uncharacterized protein n=1 Tax=Hevea brasiliensis TaxID=3981 RepID=A0A6A6K7A8_HEVBR|nr:hypothetical protein GH714_020185 [Hevea brasiliensis]
MAGSAAASTEGNGGEEVSLKDKGNEFFKAGNYLKAAALYTQAIKLDPSNPILYSNRAAAFLQLVKLNKALADAETTITLNPQWEKGYFRKGCVLEAMERYADALAAFQTSLQYNPRSTESEKIGSEECWKEMFSFLVETMEKAVKSWHETSKVDPRVYFLLDKEKTETDKYAPVVNIDKAFESPHTHSSCVTFLRQYAEESFSQAACLVVPKSIISYPQVWKGQGSRKWKHGQHDGFFVQLECPFLRKLWDPEPLDISARSASTLVQREAGQLLVNPNIFYMVSTRGIECAFRWEGVAYEEDKPGLC